jgi:hypothetical protein
VLRDEIDVEGMRARAFAWVLDHDWARVGEKIEEIYLKAIASRTS